jgi:hypothetical protein
MPTFVCRFDVNLYAHVSMQLDHLPFSSAYKKQEKACNIRPLDNIHRWCIGNIYHHAVVLLLQGDHAGQARGGVYFILPCLLKAKFVFLQHRGEKVIECRRNLHMAPIAGGSLSVSCLYPVFCAMNFGWASTTFARPLQVYFMRLCTFQKSLTHTSRHSGTVSLCNTPVG